MFYILYFFILLSLLFTVSCNVFENSNSYKSHVNTETSNINHENFNKSQTKDESDFKITAEIYGDKENLIVKVELNEENNFGVVDVRFNNINLEKIITENKLEFQGSMFPFQKENELIILTNGNKEHSFKIKIDPLSFNVEEPFEFHRNSDNFLKLTRKYDSPDELWIYTSGEGENVGEFKEWASFNAEKDTIIIPKRDAQKLNTGDAELEINDYHYGGVESNSEQFPIKIVTSFISKVKLKVVP